MTRSVLPLLFTLLAIGGALTRAAAAPAALLQDFTPASSDEPLVNPGMGLYLMGTLNPADMPPDAWFTKLLNIGYFRDDWSKLEPDKEGQYRFDEYFAPIFNLWVNRWHKRVAFRFMSANMHSQRKYVTPKWVFDSGVPGVIHKGIYVPEQVDPVFWDDHYLKIQERFIAELGKYLDGRPGLEYIDIGSIGEWGEMHLARWTEEQLRATGYTDARYVEAYRRIIDAFAEAFPHTRVFLNVGDWDTINDYAAIHHLNFRQDGLTPEGPSSNVGKRFYVPYSRRGVQCNYELWGGYDDMKQKGWGIKETFDKGLEDPISYFHINLMGYQQLQHPPAEVKTAVMDAARRIGFRFRMTHLRCSSVIHVSDRRPSRLLVQTDWKNEGVAPCYESYALRWSLVDAAGKTASEQIAFPKTPTTQWWPGEAISDNSVVTIPVGLPAGEYRLKVAMIKPEDPSVSIQLGMAGQDSQGRYDLLSIPAQKVESAPAVVYEEGFEQGTGGWAAATGITIRQDGNAHTGRSALLVTGTEPGKDWSYAYTTLKAPVLSASRYRLSCWMKVDRIDALSYPPYLKIGLYDANGKWRTNFGTSKYDTTKLGTWQYLTGVIETRPDTANGHLAIEKGALEPKINLMLHLDDIKLELLEAP